MAIAHARPAELLSISPLGIHVATERSATLIKTGSVEVIRLVLPAGKRIGEHQVTGEVLVQCLEGKVRFTAGDSDFDMLAGSLFYLEGASPHALEALEDSSLLVTILFRHGAQQHGE